eukprot:00120.XXX_1154_1613_1 [CDS] Oithona nana genome sequencing.
MFLIFLISFLILGTFGENQELKRTLCQKDDQCQPNEFCDDKPVSCGMKGCFGECKVKQPKSSLVEGKVCRFDGHCEEGEYCERYITPFIGHCTSKLSDANLPQCYCKYLSDCGNFGCGTWCDTATKMCTVWPWKK